MCAINIYNYPEISPEVNEMGTIAFLTLLQLTSIRVWGKFWLLVVLLAMY